MTANKTLIFKKVPTGFPVAGEHLAIEDRPIDLDAAPPKGGMVVENLFTSFDPYLRGRMREASIKSYSPPFGLNEPIVTDCICKVLKSDDPDFKEGETIQVFLPIAQYAKIIHPALQCVRKISNPYNLELGLFLGPLGLPGLAAWSGLYQIGQPKKGETIYISSAAGAVGQVVGQIAKREGLRVIGSVGSDEKLDFIINELGYDAGFNYKKESPQDALARLAPDGLDINFENVGGDNLEAALSFMNTGGRIAICGLIDNYNSPENQKKGIKGISELLTNQLTMEGFHVDKPGFGLAYAKEHERKMQLWLNDGTIKAKLFVTEGIENAADGLVGIFHGANFGKAVLKI